MFKQERAPPGHYLPMKTAAYRAPCAFCGILDATLACKDCNKTLYCSPGCQRADLVIHRHGSCFRAPNFPAQPLQLNYQSYDQNYGQEHGLPGPGQEDFSQYIPVPDEFRSDGGGPSYGPHPEREQVAIRNLLDIPDVNIPISERQSEPIALNRKLMPHQLVGLTWLINQENGPHKGGILADDMGLGKTIQALALILSHPPQNSTHKTTLIVVPTSLLRQWEREIDDKVNPGHKLKTIVFHGGKKRNMTVAKLLSHDIVITTYGTLAHEWKQIYVGRGMKDTMLLSPNTMFHRVILDEAHNIKNRNAQSSKAVDRLHATYRLCMTGTPLMNRIHELFPLIRFLRIEPYQEWDIFRRHLIPKNDDTVAPKQLHVLLGCILLRRTEKTIVDGQPILNLPELTVQTVEAAFDNDQLEYYKALEQRSQIRMNKYLREGTVTRNYWVILLLILRLRQCCCHPYLIKDHSIPEGVNMAPGDMIKLARKLPMRIVNRIKLQEIFECPMCHEDTKNPIIIHPCGHYVCGDCITNIVSVREPGPDVEGEGTGALMGQCPAEGCEEPVDLTKVICYEYFSEVHPPDRGGQGDLDEESSGDEVMGDADEEGNLKGFVVSDDEYETSESDDSPRSIDVSEPNAPHRPDSLHPVPEVGSDDSNYSDSEDSDDSFPPIDLLLASCKDRNESSKATPNTPLASLSDTRQNGRNNAISSGTRQARAATRLGSDAEQDAIDEGNSSISKKGGKRLAERGVARPNKKAKTGTLGALKKSSGASAAGRVRYFSGLRKEWETSAKIDKAMELLGMIRRAFPNEKTLVFSQFTSFLDLMEIPVADNGYNYRRYDGSLSSGNREAVVDDFMKKPDVTVMLLSLRCGNAGLNLYAATRVIMLDPFWNPSVEDQAIKRAHRLGQTKPVTAYRILVKETVEDRILELQEGKRLMVSNVLNPENREGVSRLNVSELAGLFGIKWTG